MTTLALVLLGLVALAGCASHDSVRDIAVTNCRSGGYLSAVQDNGAWYCFKGPALNLPMPK